MTKEKLEEWITTLVNIKVPVGLLNEITIPILAVANDMRNEIRLMEEEKQGKEGKAHADDQVQREEAEPEQH